MHTKLILSLLIVAGLLGGCASNSQKASVYQTGQVQEQMKVVIATVIDVREIDIEHKSTQHGAHIGAAGGALAAGSLDSRGGLVAGVAGAVVGGLAGAAAEQAMVNRKGLEIVYKVEGSGETLALVQEKDDQNIQPGDRIRIIQGSFSARAVKLPKAG